jgi:hypothetical protein
MFWRKI